VEHSGKKGSTVTSGPAARRDVTLIALPQLSTQPQMNAEPARTRRTPSPETAADPLTSAVSAALAMADARSKATGREDQPPQALRDLVAPHVRSFDFFAGEGLSRIAEGVPPVQSRVHGHDLEIAVEDLRLGSAKGFSLPSDARERKRTHKAPLSAHVRWSHGESQWEDDVQLGEIPVMVCSSCCSLANLSKRELVKHREEAHEVGGYFVVNGNERLVRMILVQRRHSMLALRRKAYLNRGPEFSDLAVAMRCVRPDERSSTSRVHYMNTGTCRLAVLIRKQELFVPPSAALKALVPCTDREIYERILGAAVDTESSEFGDQTFTAHRVELMLADSQRLGLVTQEDHLCYLGRHFRVVLEVDDDTSDAEAGRLLLQRHILVHCKSFSSKFQLLLLMLSKLYTLASGSCEADNPDALSNQELLLPGNLLMMFLSERIRDFLIKARDNVIKDAQKPMEAFETSRVRRCIDSARRNAHIDGKMEYTLATGNIPNAADLGLSQSSGFTIIAEKVNYLRWLAHFRSVHRGQYFATLRTTTVRKMLPESWGFLCPVHTPDGSPCGLLNHLTAQCQVQTEAPSCHQAMRMRILQELSAHGMYSSRSPQIIPLPPFYVPVMIDGVFEGSLPSDVMAAAAHDLRDLKLAGA